MVRILHAAAWSTLAFPGELNPISHISEVGQGMRDFNCVMKNANNEPYHRQTGKCALRECKLLPGKHTFFIYVLFFCAHFRTW